MTGSLASVHPELIPEWSEKNLPLTPDKITFGSNKRVWWNHNSYSPVLPNALVPRSFPKSRTKSAIKTGVITS